jgi:hypothetical protein
MITQTKENICTTPTPLEQEASLLYNLCSNLQFYCPRWLKYVLFYLANSFIHIFFIVVQNYKLAIAVGWIRNFAAQIIFVFREIYYFTKFRQNFAKLNGKYCKT